MAFHSLTSESSHPNSVTEHNERGCVVADHECLNSAKLFILLHLLCYDAWPIHRISSIHCDLILFQSTFSLYFFYNSHKKVRALPVPPRLRKLWVTFVLMFHILPWAFLIAIYCKSSVLGLVMSKITGFLIYLRGVDLYQVSFVQRFRVWITKNLLST